MQSNRGVAGVPQLTFALGDYPYMSGIKPKLLKSNKVTLIFPKFSNINRAFAPMARHAAYDISEMAIATFLLARHYGKPLVPLPIITAARFQQYALICKINGPVESPLDLVDRRVGVRSYSQTTAAWLRGILEEQFGVKPSDIHWVTQEASHLLEYTDPPWTERGTSEQNLLTLLREGKLDAVIVGNDYKPEPGFRSVFGDIDASIEKFWLFHNFVPVNHLVTVTADLVNRHPEIIVDVMNIFLKLPYRIASAGHECLTMGRFALQPSIDLMQKYLGLRMDHDEIWNLLPAAVP